MNRSDQILESTWDMWEARYTDLCKSSLQPGDGERELPLHFKEKFCPSSSVVNLQGSLVRPRTRSPPFSTSLHQPPHAII